jgi:hypothetical protein
VCLLCERRGRKGKPRLCSRTFRIVCQACKDSAASIPPIDMLGRVVVILSKQYILAPCCATVQEYVGTGRDLVPGKCMHSHAFRREGGEVCVSAKPRRTCEVCDCQALSRGHDIVDHLAARMTTVFLCYRHTPSDEWIRRCANRRQFELTCREWDAKVKKSHRRG